MTTLLLSITRPRNVLPQTRSCLWTRLAAASAVLPAPASHAASTRRQVGRHAGCDDSASISAACCSAPVRVVAAVLKCSELLALCAAADAPARRRQADIQARGQRRCVACSMRQSAGCSLSLASLRCCWAPTHLAGSHRTLLLTSLHTHARTPGELVDSDDEAAALEDDAPCLLADGGSFQVSPSVMYPPQVRGSQP